MHNKRSENGQYREAHASAASREARAREETQTHEGLFTHTRDAAARRMFTGETQLDAKLFKDRRVNRDAYRPKV